MSMVGWLKHMRQRLIPLVLIGCVALSAGLGDARADNNAVPPNYRQVVARALAKMVDRNAYRDARISEPFKHTTSMFIGMPEPMVCVSAAPVRGGEHPIWIFLFQDGQVSKVFYPMRIRGCFLHSLSPFPEFHGRV
jgi:hypothetical protein